MKSTFFYRTSVCFSNFLFIFGNRHNKISFKSLIKVALIHTLKKIREVEKETFNSILILSLTTAVSLQVYFAKFNLVQLCTIKE